MYINVCNNNTFTRPVFGNVSKLSLYSSPLRPFFWPLNIRPAVIVDIPIPSPIKMIMFFALFSIFRKESTLCRFS